MFLWWQKRTRLEQGLIVLVSTLLVGVIVVMCSILPLSSWDFRNNLWGPAHLLVTGRSPYRIDQLFDGSNSVWLPTTIGALSPLGLLSLGQATTLWGVAAFVTYGVILFVSMQTDKPALLWLAVALLMAFLFPSYLSHVGLGQFSIFSILLAFLIAELLDRRAPVWGLALCLVLMCTKPQLVPLVGIGVLGVLYQRGGLRAWAALVTWSGVFTALFLMPLFLRFPDWIEGMVWAFTRNAVWLQPSSLHSLSTSLGTVGIILWAALTLFTLAVTVWQWRHMPARDAVVWSLALTVLVTPYVWSYDFVLLIPLLIYTLFGVRWWLPRSVLTLGYAVVWGYFVYLRVASTNSDEVFWWIPGICLVLILLCWGLNRLRPEQTDVAPSIA